MTSEAGFCPTLHYTENSQDMEPPNANANGPNSQHTLPNNEMEMEIDNNRGPTGDPTHVILRRKTCFFNPFWSFWVKHGSDARRVQVDLLHLYVSTLH